MTMPKKIQMKVELTEYLYQQGWAVFPVSKTGVNTDKKALGGMNLCDVVAMKDGSVRFFVVHHFSSANSSKKVKADALALRDLQSKAGGMSLVSDMDFKSGFAIKLGSDRKWYFVDPSIDRIKPDDLESRLSEVI